MAPTYECSDCGAHFSTVRRSCEVCGTTGGVTDRETCPSCGSRMTETDFQPCPVCGSDDVERWE